MNRLLLSFIVALGFTSQHAVSQHIARSPFVSFTNRDIAARAATTLDFTTSDNYRPLVFSLADSLVDNAVYQVKAKVSLGEMDRDVFVVFDDVRAPFEFRINGQLVGFVGDPVVNCTDVLGAVSGRYEFLVDRFIRQGDNLFTVIPRYCRGVNGGVPTVLPAPACGIPFVGGATYLTSQPMARIEDYTISAMADTLSVSEKKAKQTPGVFGIEIAVVNSFNAPSGPLQMWYELEDENGTLVDYSYSELELDNYARDTVRLMRRLRNVKLWSAEHPNLYKAVLKVRQRGVFTEYTSQWIGFRSIQAVARDSMSLFVNGRKVAIKGAKLPDDINYSDVKTIEGILVKLRKAGYNAVSVGVRMPQALYRLTDKYGFYVSQSSGINTTFGAQGLRVGESVTNDPQLLNHFLDASRDIYLLNKNVTSIVLWETGRGITNGYNMQRAYQVLHQLDSLRLTWYTGSESTWNSDLNWGDNTVFKPLREIPALQVQRPQPKAATKKVVRARRITGA